jgi:hypothetical protein
MHEIDTDCAENSFFFDGKSDGVVDLAVKLASCNGVHHRSTLPKTNRSLTIEWE